MNSLNENLISSLLEITSTCKIEKLHGDSIDNSFLSKIKRYTGAREIQREDWKTNYKPFFRWDNNDGSCSISINQNKPIIINKPLGSQKTPDFILIYGKSGIGFESKSSTHQKITWNSGLPKKYIIYIFNGAPPIFSNYPSTTIFMGFDIITDDEIRILESCRTSMELCVIPFNNKLKNISSNFSMYPRPMHDSNEQIITNKNRESREKHVIEYIKDFKWN